MTPSSPKSFLSGTHRTVTPAQTLEKITPLFSKMGITRLANVTGLDYIGIPVFTACRPNAKAISVSQGKGISNDAAMASAAMEAIETWHAENIDLPTRFCSFNALKNSHQAIDLDSLPKMDVRSFNEHEKRLWIEAQNLTSKEKIYVPYDLAHCDFTLPLPQGSGCFQLSTNGLASGNTFSEAISHGLCELIERDALTLWSFVPTSIKSKRKVSLDSIIDPTINALITKIRSANILISIWDITSDIGIPTFQATILSEHPDQYRPLYPMSGSGTHPDKHVALMRALTEAVQTRLTLISGSRDDSSLSVYKSKQNLELHQKIRNELLITPSFVDFNEIDSWVFDTIEEDLELQITKLAAQGLGCPLFIDLTKAEFDIPVVKVISPGLEGIHDVPGYKFGKRALAFQAKVKAVKESV
ncbi:YcaO-like family protein [Marinomonas balearica]|uniref:Ribosomal protein S12 methylthiotransferase accessory factor n=1 Tax=Marinomonas balearica TaxID=491947 RepID=A0A4R6MER6_9GAMM|nr:YcaO-like family protein [Marinomonas balearica]TDO99946.1 ribosomal protein S12 methylthiotransferase accessory factor [Marinomonas balearica]